MRRVFTPRKMDAIEPKVREFCRRSLDPLVGSGRFDFIHDLGAQMPMRTIGYLLGIPEQDQVAIRERHRRRACASRRARSRSPRDQRGGDDIFGSYIDWRAEHPSDDIMTDLLTAEFVDETGTKRTADPRRGRSRTCSCWPGAGNETTTRLIGWTGKILAENPDQRRELVADPSLIPNAIEELLRYESPSPVQARYVSRDVEHYGTTIPEGSIMLLLNGSANRDERHFADPDRFDIHRNVGRHLAFGYGVHFCLGAALARLEGRVALEEVLKRFPNGTSTGTTPCRRAPRPCGAGSRCPSSSASPVLAQYLVGPRREGRGEQVPAREQAAVAGFARLPALDPLAVTPRRLDQLGVGQQRGQRLRRGTRVVDDRSAPLRKTSVGRLTLARVGIGQARGSAPRRRRSRPPSSAPSSRRTPAGSASRKRCRLRGLRSSTSTHSGSSTTGSISPSHAATSDAEQ